MFFSLSHHILLQLTGIFVLGILAQWAAWRLKLPSIVLLLTIGILAGPVTGWLHPDTLFGELMLPAVSLSVAVILYEGGLSLKFRDLKSIGTVFFRLATIGALITWFVGSVAARYILGYEWPVALLLGAILIVTGPTVVGPILRRLRMRGKVGALLKWEGIIIDPIGATVAVLVFTVIRVGVNREGLGAAAVGLGLTLTIGITVGAIAAGFLIVALRRYWIPDSLHNPVSLMLVFVAMTASNIMQAESGLLSVTVMGIVLANQKIVSVQHVHAFKETLTILLISCLFITLSARIPLAELKELGFDSFIFVGVLIFVARPLAALASTWRSSLTWQERCFLCFMAPRGIVAAAIASVTALSLIDEGYTRASEIVPVTFLMVFISVLLYGIGARPLAKKLGLTQLNPQGILFIGADPWVRAIAAALQEEGCAVCLVDTDRENVNLARMAGLTCIYGSALVEETREQLDFGSLGRMLAVTSNNEVNSLACLRYADEFGREEIYQLTIPEAKKGLREQIPLEHRGRQLFNSELTFTALSSMLSGPFTIKKTKLSKEFGYTEFQKANGESAIPLFILKSDGSIRVFVGDTNIEAKESDLLISLVSTTARKTEG